MQWPKMSEPLFWVTYYFTQQQKNQREAGLRHKVASLGQMSNLKAGCECDKIILGKMRKQIILITKQNKTTKGNTNEIKRGFSCVLTLALAFLQVPI